jgi:hypothetical protein
MRFLVCTALGACSLAATAEPQHPPSYPPKAPDKLRPPPVDQPADPLMLATGDFDGDERPDTVERIPGARRNSLRIQVRLAARPDSPYFIMEGSPASHVAATEIKVGPAGVYVVDKVTGVESGKVTVQPDPTAMPHDVVLVRLDRPNWHGFILKYWAVSSDDFVGVNWPDSKGPS